MPIFQPPTARVTPHAPPGTRGLAVRLFRHYRPLPKGLSVLQLADESWVTKEYPTQEEVDSSLHYFIGGHVYTVTDEVASLLTAAGYGGYVT